MTRLQEVPMTTLNDATPEVTVKELTVDEGRALFEQTAQDRLGVSGAEFIKHHEADDFPADWSEQAIQDVEFLLPFVR